MKFPHPSPPPRTGPSLVALLAFLALGSAAPGTVVVVDSESANPPGMISARLLPQQPTSRVFDSTGQLATESKAELAVALARAAARGVEIHVALLAAAPDIEPNKLGNELVRRWTPPEAEIGVLVLALPTTDEPLVFLRNRLASPAEATLISTLAQSALDESYSPPRAYGTALELAATLPDALARIARERAGSAVPERIPDRMPDRVEAPASAPLAAGRPETTRSHWDMLVARLSPHLKLLLRDLALGLGGLVLLAATLVVLRLRRPRFFPLVEFRHRFQAPYSGGNNARAATTRRAPPVHVPHG